MKLKGTWKTPNNQRNLEKEKIGGIMMADFEIHYVAICNDMDGARVYDARWKESVR